MLYTEYIADIRNWFWETEESELIKQKRKGKEFARSLGFQVAEEYPMPASFLWKPNRGTSSRGVKIVENSQEFLVEELLVDLDGSIPPKNYNMYVFGSEVKIVQVSSRTKDFQNVCHGLYTLPDWECQEIMTGRPHLQADPPPDLDQMVEGALLVQKTFPTILRVDFYQTASGPVFGELCATPGLSSAKNCRLTTEGDQMFGDWIPEEYLRETKRRTAEKQQADASRNSLHTNDG